MGKLPLSQHKSKLESDHRPMGYDLKTFAANSLCM